MAPLFGNLFIRKSQMKATHLFIFLIIFAASSANAVLFTYDLTFEGGNATEGVKGYGRIVADSELDAIVLFGMRSTDSTPGFEVDFLWEGVSALVKRERYYFGDLIEMSPFTVLNFATGLSITVRNDFLISGLTGGPYVHRLDDHFAGEFDTFLGFGESRDNPLYVFLNITKVPESSSLMLFFLGFMCVLFKRKGLNRH